MLNSIRFFLFSLQCKTFDQISQINMEVPPSSYTIYRLFSLLAWVQWVYVMANFNTPCITSSQVFRGLPLPICPTTISLHLITQLSLSTLVTCSNHLVYPSACSFLCLPIPGDLSTCQKTFYPSVSHNTSTVPS